jgi:hypothetical protein
MTREQERVLHNIGDQMHEHVTEFNPPRPGSPEAMRNDTIRSEAWNVKLYCAGRYGFCFNPDDPTVLLCLDMESKPPETVCLTMDEGNKAVFEYVHEVINRGE